MNEETKIEETKVEAPVEEVSQEDKDALEACAKEIAAVLEKHGATLRIQNNILVAKK